jgi:hypothetical protein
VLRALEEIPPLGRTHTAQNGLSIHQAPVAPQTA